MKGQIQIAGRWWPLVPDMLPALRAAVQEPWEHAVVRALDAWWSDEDQMKLHTSGSTGAPQTIYHPKDRMRASAERTLEALNLPEGTRAALVMPVGFVGGLMMLVRAILGGWTLKAVPPTLCPDLGEEPLDFLACTPSQAQALQRESPSVWRGIGRVLLGGGAPHAAWLRSLSGGPELWESFGMTETVSHFALRKIHPERADAFSCLPGFEVASGAEDTLVLRTPWGETLQTRDAVIVADARTFHWLGRLDDVVNSGGVKVHPGQVEEALAALISEPFRCYGAPDARFGQILILRIHANQRPPDADDRAQHILSWARKNLPKHHAPKSVEWQPLEQTGSGKWKRPKFED